MDAVQNGQSFTVTRDGHRIGELIALRRRRRFVPGGWTYFSELRASSTDFPSMRKQLASTAGCARPLSARAASPPSGGRPDDRGHCHRRGRPAVHDESSRLKGLEGLLTVVAVNRPATRS
jgi:hypothetical protein